MIARVLVDSPLPHLDRLFDYALNPEWSHVCAGTRVRVPFAGRLVSGIVWDVVDSSDVAGVKPVKSAAIVPSIDKAGLELAQAISHRYGGSRWDMIRLMVPPRVAAVEKAPWLSEPVRPTQLPRPSLQMPPEQPEPPSGSPARIAWCAPPRSGEPLPGAELWAWLLGAAGADASAIAVMPDARAVRAVMTAAAELGLRRWTPASGGEIAVLDADDGPRLRYATHLAALRGNVRLVVGTRTVAWQPVPRLGGVAIWDEAAGTMQDPRAPYPHARTVAALRSQRDGSALLLAGRVLSTDAAALVEHGFAVLASTDGTRGAAPTIEIVDDTRRRAEGGTGSHWLPHAAFKPLASAAREAVAAVLVPQAGYAQGIACLRCDAWGSCASCGGDLLARQAAPSLPPAAPVCADCATQAVSWHCSSCGGYRWKPAGLGVERAAEQLERMLPEVDVSVSSSGTGILQDDEVPRGLVVATPGALPAVAGGYRHIVIVGARVTMAAGLGAEVDAVRRWLTTAALGAGRSSGGGVTLVGDVPSALRPAVLSFDGFETARRDLTVRTEAMLPPHRRSMRLDGPAMAITAVESRLGDRADFARDADGAWVLATRAAMQDVVDVARAVAVERSASGDTPLYLRVDALPGPS